MSEEIIEHTEHDVEKRIKDFSSLLNSLTNIGDKKKQLWIEIYQNAISDRQNAYVMFINLVKIVNESTSKSTEHAVHGKTISTYIERMSRANDQLIKLAELIARAEEESKEISSDEMYERLRS